MNVNVIMTDNQSILLAYVLTSHLKIVDSTYFIWIL